MQTIILNGKKLAEKLHQNIKIKALELQKKTGKKPTLAVCLIGEDPASQIYVNKKQQTAEELNINSIIERLPSNSSIEEVIKLVKNWNDNPGINGILVQLPLPNNLNSDLVINEISPIKDVDGLHPENLGLLCLGTPQMIPCTPFGIYSIFKEYNLEISGKRALVIGRSRLVGKPIAQILTNESATVTIAHSKTSKEELDYLLKTSDIVVAAIGVPHFINGEQLKENSIIIDVGINRIDIEGKNKLVGDIDYESCLNKVQAITPVPGGVGPLTVAHLMINTLKAFEIQNQMYNN